METVSFYCFSILFDMEILKNYRWDTSTVVLLQLQYSFCEFRRRYRIICIWVTWKYSAFFLLILRI